MADVNGGGGGGGNNVAIIAIIVIGVLVAGAAFIYFQGGFSADKGPTVIERETVIERPADPEPEPAPTPPAPEEPGFSIEHEDDEGSRTEIKTP